MKLRAGDVLALLSELTVVMSGIRCAPLYCSTYDRAGVGPPPSIGAVFVVQVIHVLAPQHLSPSLSNNGEKLFAGFCTASRSGTDSGASTVAEACMARSTWGRYADGDESQLTNYFIVVR